MYCRWWLSDSEFVGASSSVKSVKSRGQPSALEITEADSAESRVISDSGKVRLSVRDHNADRDGEQKGTDYRYHRDGRLPSDGIPVGGDRLGHFRDVPLAQSARQCFAPG